MHLWRAIVQGDRWLSCLFSGHRWIRRDGWASTDVAILTVRRHIAGLPRRVAMTRPLPARICARCGRERP